MKNNNIVKNYQKEYEKNGFVLIKNFIDKSKCIKAYNGIFINFRSLDNFLLLFLD